MVYTHRLSITPALYVYKLFACDRWILLDKEGLLLKKYGHHCRREVLLETEWALIYLTLLDNYSDRKVFFFTVYEQLVFQGFHSVEDEMCACVFHYKSNVNSPYSFLGA